MKVCTERSTCPATPSYSSFTASMISLTVRSPSMRSQMNLPTSLSV